MTEEKIQQVDESKQALKDFIRIVSHDMRAPIRHIREFYGLFLDSLDIEFTDDQKELKRYLDEAISLASEQMERLLLYSRLNTIEMVVAEVDVARVLESCIVSIQADGHKEVNISLQVASEIEPVVSCENNIYRACREVIHNAVIFVPKDEEPVINIRLSCDQGRVSIVVEDKGLGIDPKFEQDVFIPFRQLNHKKEFPGVGMGLALAQKAMQKVAGDVVVKGNDYGGVTCTLSFPTTF